MKLSLLTKGSWKHCAFGTPSENFIADLPFHYCLFPHRGSSQIIAKANLSQTCKKSGTWEPGSRTFLEKNSDIFFILMLSVFWFNNRDNSVMGMGDYNKIEMAIKMVYKHQVFWVLGIIFTIL